MNIHITRLTYVRTGPPPQKKNRGRDSVRAHAQLSLVYLASTLDVTHVIKCTRLSPTLTGRAWGRGYSAVH